MRILLVMNGEYGSSLGGALKANRVLLESMAARGHECAALTPALSMYGPGLGNVGTGGEGEVAVGAVGPTTVHRVRETTPAGRLRLTNLRAYLPRLTGEIRPDLVLVASEDQAQVLFRATLQAAQGPVVYIARSSWMLGVGPFCFFPNGEAPGLFARAAGIIANSRYLAGYLERWAGGPAPRVFDVPTYGAGPFPGPPEEGFVTLINPCVLKGSPLFLQLARALPEVRFAAVPTWGTTAKDRAALESLDNVTLLPPTEKIDEIYGQTRILLVPSLADEAFGRVAVEAMLHGIPVLASRVGGLPEAKLGVDHLLDVDPIRGYTNRLDDRNIPIPIVGPQDPRPWIEALHGLLSDERSYADLSRASREAAGRYVAGLDSGPLESYLRGIAG